MIQVGEVPTCQEIVEAVTDYLDGSLSEADCACLEQHLILCDGCDEFVQQLRSVIRTSAELAPRGEGADERQVQDLLEVFRARRRGQP